MGCHFLLQGIFLTQGSNPHLLHLLHQQADSLPLHHLGSPKLTVDKYKPTFLHFLERKDFVHMGLKQRRELKTNKQTKHTELKSYRNFKGFLTFLVSLDSICIIYTMKISNYNIILLRTKHWYVPKARIYRTVQKWLLMTQITMVVWSLT